MTPVKFVKAYRSQGRKTYKECTREDFLLHARKFFLGTKRAKLNATIQELFQYLTDECLFDNGSVRTVGWWLMDARFIETDHDWVITNVTIPKKPIQTPIQEKRSDAWARSIIHAMVDGLNEMKRTGKYPEVP